MSTTRLIRIVFCTAALLGVASLAHANHVECSRDINNDGKADRNDLKILTAAMGSTVGAAPYDERADFNQDGFVNSDDTVAYQHCAPPPPPAKAAGRRSLSR